MNENTESNLDEQKLGNGKMVNEMLMKPFNFGWTREVVNRVIVKNGAPNCDIYYYSPNGKKIRSLIEAKSNLTDGLTPECFTFKKEILGLGSKYETVRDARVRKKQTEKKPVNTKKLTISTNTSKPDLDNEKAEKSDNDKEETVTEEKEKEPESSEANTEKKAEKSGIKRENEEAESGRPQRMKKKKTEESNKKLTKKNETKKRISSRIKPAVRRKSVLKKIIEAKQLKKAKSVTSKIKSKKAVASSSKKKINVKSKQLKKVVEKKFKSQKKMKSALSNKSRDSSKLKNISEADKRSTTSDLKSIVKKNIGKYRELREKQKLGVIKTPIRKQDKKIVVSSTRRPRSEPIAKYKQFYLKPLEKGWRRELVFRNNSGNTSKQLADVYYFHPSGRKLRSLREISENLTPGLTIECFTFKKEALECGEPAEVVRNARQVNRN